MFSLFKLYYRFFSPLLILLFLWVIGTVGYVIIDNYNWFDAFYMTVITVATVGYGEVQPLSHAGKTFTAFLIITSFGTFAYAVSSITKFVFDGEFNEFYKNQKLNASIEKLSDHIIICGYGRNGRQAAQVLKKHNQRFVVIESNVTITNSLNHKHSDLVIFGDGTQDEILLKAGIHRAKALITTLPVDADNVFIVLTARNLNKNLTIISRASEDNSDTKLKIAGANNVIMPDKVGGAHMASLVMKPDVIEFIDTITSERGNN
ncbi:MAG: potassium channel family protein, partial [Bacteroidia bacterium]|nr:potassium channel family protein [Bacteroidia bacterium]